MLNGISNQKSSQGQGKNNLIFLILILGMFSIVSIGIIVVTVVKRIRPDVFAAPGIYKTLNYQGKLEDSGGITVPDGAYNIKFTIYDAAAAGNVLWTARESDACGAPFNPSAKSVTTSLGVFSTQLGESGDCPLNLDFNTDSYYLGITVGADSEMTPRKRIGAAGYAFNADLLDGLNTSLVGGASSFIPATDTSGNLVLTANITFDTTTFALDSTNDNIGIGTAAPDITRTLDLTTAKQYGIYAVTSSASKDTVAVYGESSDATNNTRYGGYFTAAGGGSAGVYGSATAAGNPLVSNFGGLFTSAGDSGKGVYGNATATGAVTNIGGYFLASGDTGVGVRGATDATGAGTVGVGGEFTSSGEGGYGISSTATGTTGVNYGGYFLANGPGGYGVKTWASDTTAAANYGGYFTAAGTGGDTAGVYGSATAAAAGTTFGVYGLTASTNTGSSGVFGLASATASVYGVGGEVTDNGAATTNYGGHFSAAGGTGVGVYGEATYLLTATVNYGGYFTAAGTGGAMGVYGEATGTGAGITNYGGYFSAAGETGRGVYGEATSTVGTNYGGFFQTAGKNSYGVYGVSTDSTADAINFGGYFVTSGTATGTAGVKGQANGAGVVAGVYGVASDATAVANYGGYFEAGGQGGARGAYGKASGAGGTNYGVYGEVTSAVGWGGYFTGGNGLYADRFSIADSTSGVAYNTIGTAVADQGLAAATDLFIAGKLEVDGASYFDGGHTDLAEMVAYSGEGEAGDVVVVDENNDNAAKLATKPYDQSVLGIISTKPSLIITGDIKEGKLLAVAGRVPTKVSNINGAIHRGDLLTTSSVHGRAMKATEAGPIVGKAMGECAEDECTIWVFLNVSWYGGAMAETMAVDSPTVSDSKTLFEPESLLDKLAAIWKKIIGR